MRILDWIWPSKKSERSGIPLSQITSDIGSRLGLAYPPSSSGVIVSEQTALTLAALWRAARVVSESVGTMPLKLYTRTQDGREEATSDPLYRLLHDEPNEEMGSVDFLSQMQFWSVIYGNAYAEISRAGATPVALWPIPPWTVSPARDSTGRLVYRVGADLVLDSADVIHVAGPRPDPTCEGYRLCHVARESLGMLLATDRFCNRAFSNNMKLGGTITHPGQLSENARENLRQSWRQEYAGVENSGKWALLEEGMQANPFQINNEQSQLVELRSQLVLEVCRWVGVDPIFVYEYGRATWSNAEAQTRNFLQFSLHPWLCKWESELNRKVVRSSTTYAEFVRESVVQMDSLTQAQIFALGRKHGWLQVADIRHKLNLPPIPEPAPEPVQQTQQKDNANAL